MLSLLASKMITCQCCDYAFNAGLKMFTLYFTLSLYLMPYYSTYIKYYILNKHLVSLLLHNVSNKLEIDRNRNRNRNRNSNWTKAEGPKASHYCTLWLIHAFQEEKHIDSTAMEHVTIFWEIFLVRADPESWILYVRLAQCKDWKQLAC